MKRWFLMGLVAALLTIAAIPAGASAQTAEWTAQFYDNRFLVGSAVSRNINTVSFDWGSDAPVPGVGADNFSARFSSRAFFEGGTYRFFARADDEVRVTVDFQVIIDTLDAPRVGDVLTADVNLSNGFHQVQVDYRENTGDAYVFVTWENANSNPTSPQFPPTTTTTTQQVTAGPWIVQYFGNNTLSGLPTAIFTENQITKDWGNGSPVPSVPTDNFSARWSASPLLDTGQYRITARADDGVRVFVDGQQVIDRWNGQVGVEQTADLDLAQGQHTIIVEYYEVGGVAFVEFDLSRLQEIEVFPTAIPAVKIPSNVDPANPVSQPQNTNATGTVDAYRLNVRSAPTTSADIVVKIEDGETYPIIGRNADDSWWQVNVNGAVGWVFADFIVPVNTVSVPLTSNSSEAQNLPSTGLQLTATGTVRLRSRPSSRGAVLGVLPFGARANIIGRDRDGQWIQVDYNGNVGWVSRGFVNLPVDLNQLPLGVE